MSFEQGTSAEDIFKDPLQEMARIWRIMRRRWRNFKGRFGNRRSPQQVMARAALEAFRDRNRYDLTADQRHRQFDQRELHAQLDRQNRAQVRNLDRDGNGIDDRHDARNRDVEARNGRLRDEDGAVPAVIDADSFEVVRDDVDRERADQQRNRDDRNAEERREERRDRDGVDAATALAAGGAAAVVANEAEDRLDADRNETQAETEARADNERQTETDSELEAQTDNQAGSAEQDQRFLDEDGSVNQEALNGIDEYDADLARDEQDFATAMNEAGERGAQQVESEADREQPEGLYADDRSPENEVDTRALEEDGSARSVIGAENVRAEPEFVNADNTVNQEALNGIQEETEQDRTEREERQERQEIEPGEAEVGGFATGGDHAAAEQVEAATARDVEPGQGGRVTAESGQETLDRVIAEQREQQGHQGGRHAQGARPGMRSVEEMKQMIEARDRAIAGVADASEAPRQPVVAASGGRGGQTPGRQHAQETIRTTGPAEGLSRDR